MMKTTTTSPRKATDAFVVLGSARRKTQATIYPGTPESNMVLQFQQP
jgi:hypothetical protein